MKRFLTLAVMFALIMALCVSPCAGAEGAPFTPGTYTGEAPGFGGQVIATVTVGDAGITEVSIAGESETPGIGAAALPQLEANALAQGAEMDGVTGATFTSNAARQAVAEALKQASGTAPAAGKMAPGTYTGEAWGFNKVEKIKASVEVTEDRIQNITVDMDNLYESSVKLQIAAKLMVPRILEGQTVAVDAITGATGSSAGIRGAVTDALMQALAAGGSDGSAIADFQKASAPEAKEETLDYDVVVVGMGGSGSYTALRVAQQMRLKDPKSDASVLAIDKAGNYGGTTVFTSEALVVNPKTFQEEYNNGEDFVDAEALYQDWTEYTTSSDGVQMAKPEMIRLIMDESGNSMDWLRHNGFDFNMPAGGLSGGTTNEAKTFLVKYRFAPTQTNNRIKKDTFQQCFDHLYNKFKAYGGEYLLETEGTELIYDEATNKVTGVKAYNAVTNTSYTINAKAVVLATGGFAGSEEMSTKYLGDEYYPLKGKWNVCGSWQNDGKMIQAAIDIGAGTFNIGMTPVCHLFGPDGFLNSYPNVPVPGQFTTKTNLPAVWSEGDLPTMLCFWEKVFGVNSKGVRYLPENALATFDAWKGGPDISVIVTEKQILDIAANGIDVDDTVQHIKSNFDNLLFKVPIPRGTILPNALQVMEDGVKAGFISKGDTIEELAEELGLDPATLRAELDKYNEGCRTGEDALGKPAEFLEAMEEGPYYAIHAGMHCYGTCGGLDINEQFQVLQADGETVIGGLYAVGADGEGVIYSPERPMSPMAAQTTAGRCCPVISPVKRSWRTSNKPCFDGLV
ncbi:MAG: FAD-dependent oxidoreductase [Clostridia bacterium]|nr:FAD-dependent oxidoreductase [Clostridia bacterium]